MKSKNMRKRFVHKETVSGPLNLLLFFLLVLIFFSTVAFVLLKYRLLFLFETAYPALLIYVVGTIFWLLCLLLANFLICEYFVFDDRLSIKTIFFREDIMFENIVAIREFHEEKWNLKFLLWENITLRRVPFSRVKKGLLVVWKSPKDTKKRYLKLCPKEPEKYLTFIIRNDIGKWEIRRPIFIFRDYWSNRFELGFNRFSENSRRDFCSDMAKHLEGDIQVCEYAKNKSLVFNRHLSWSKENLMNPLYIDPATNLRLVPHQVRFERWFSSIMQVILAVVFFLSFFVMLFSILFFTSIFWIVSTVVSGIFWIFWNNIERHLGSSFQAFQFFLGAMLLAIGLLLDIYLNRLQMILASLFITFPIMFCFLYLLDFHAKIPQKVYSIVRRIKSNPCLILLIIFGSHSVFSLFLPESNYASNLFLVGGFLSFLQGFLFSYEPKNFLGSVHFYDDSIDSPVFPFRDPRNRPLWLEGRYYWVYRLLYNWIWEVTLHRKLRMPWLQPDWERIELWVNAETGKLEWIVSDFHYRELWYKAECQKVYAHWDYIFHTVAVTSSPREIEILANIADIVNQSRNFFSPHNYKRIVELANQHSFLVKQREKSSMEKHSRESLANYFPNKILAEICSKMPWEHIRYYGEPESLWKK